MAVSLVTYLIMLLVGAGSGESCSDESCIAVENAKEKVAGVLMGWYGLSRSEAWGIAEDMFSGDRVRAEGAVRRIKELGALDKVLEVLKE